MKRILIDCGNSITAEQIERGLELGFTALITYANERVAQDCRALGMKWLPILPQYGPLANRQDMAFRNAAGISNYSAKATMTPGTPSPIWPSFWHPDVIDLVRPQFEEAARFAGGKLDGAVVTTSIAESAFPTYWYGHPQGTKLATSYWCHDPLAIAAWQEQYGDDSLPAARPEDDEDNRTLQFSQDALISRLDELAELAAARGHGVYPLIQPYGYSWSHLHRAIGYSGIEARLEKWRESFLVKHPVEFAFALTSVYLGGPAQIAYTAGLCDPAGLGWPCWIGAETGVEAGERKWQRNLLTNGRRSLQAGFAGLICSSKYITQPDAQHKAEGILSAIEH